MELFVELLTVVEEFVIIVAKELCWRYYAKVGGAFLPAPYLLASRDSEQYLIPGATASNRPSPVTYLSLLLQ